MSLLKEAIIKAGRELAAGKDSTCKVEWADRGQYWRGINAANIELAPLGVSAKWAADKSHIVLVSSEPPAPAPTPDPVVEIDVDKKEEDKPKRWGI